MSGHYRTNKKEYFINLHTADAKIIQLGEGTNNFVFEWNVSLNQNLSREAKMGIVNICSNQGVSTSPITIRCKQVKNEQFESGGNTGAIIYMDNGFKTPTFEKMYPMSVQNIDVITISINLNLATKNTGIPDTYVVSLQLKVIDYDTEEVRKELMPTYTKDSVAFSYPNPNLN